MGHIQCCHHGNALGSEYLAAGAYFPHFAVQMPRGPNKCLLCFGRAGDQVFLVENFYLNGGRLLGHQWCSSARRRPIMASILFLARSFLCISWARSRFQSSCNSRSRALSFSSFSQCSISLSSLSANACTSDCSMTCSICVIWMPVTISARTSTVNLPHCHGAGSVKSVTFNGRLDCAVTTESQPAVFLPVAPGRLQRNEQCSQWNAR